MTATYQNNPIGRNIDAVRFLLGETDVDNGQSKISDEEISYKLSLSNNNIYLTCAKLCEVLALRSAKDAMVRVSNFTQDRSNVSMNYTRMAKHFRKEAITKNSFVMPSLSQSTKDISKENSDIPKPFAEKGMFDNKDTADDVSID